MSRNSPGPRHHLRQTQEAAVEVLLDIAESEPSDGHGSDAERRTGGTPVLASRRAAGPSSIPSGGAAYRECDVVLRAVAHDLRTPLNGIVLAATAARRVADSASRDEIERLLSALLEQTSIMNRLIDDLLEAAMSQPAMTDQYRRVTPESLVEAAVREHPAGSRAGALIVSVEDDLPVVCVDPDRIRRVFANLLDNARRFSPTDGSIRIDASRVPHGVRFSVVDRGPGVPPPERPNLFQPFWRGGSNRGSGCGLGLSIAKRIVESHGGTIGHSAAPAGGADFYFVLPAAGHE